MTLRRNTHSDLRKASDEQLCSMLSAGEAETAFTEIFDRYAVRIHAYCYKILKNEDAEDVFQDTFVRFHRTIEKGTEVTNLSGLLFKIAKNLCINKKQSRSRRVMLPIQDYDFPVEAHSGDKKELLGLIDMALDVLDDTYKEAFVLREYDGMSFKEIAETLDVTVSTAKIRVFRAKQKIRKVLAPYMREFA